MNISEQLYQDFTTKLLPQIQQGLMITKDYMGEFIGRYIKYLIITDILTILFWLVIIPFCIYVIKKRNDWYPPTGNGWDDKNELPRQFCFIVIAPIIIGVIVIVSSIASIVKLLIIPEIPVYEEAKSFIESNK